MSGKPVRRANEGILVDPDFLPREVRQELLDNLVSSKLAESQKEDFIAFTAEMVQAMQGDETEYATRVRQLRELARVAQALRSKAAALSDGAAEAFGAVEAHCAFSSKPPVDLSHGLIAQLRVHRAEILSDGLEWVEAIGQVAGHAASIIKVDRGARPAQHFAKGLIAELARWIVNETGSEPPKDRSGWFAGYADCLGKYLKRPMGPKVVSSAIEAVARTSEN